MMKFTSPSHRHTGYSSVVWITSSNYQNVRYAVRRVSLAQRIQLLERIHELSIKYEFLKSGSELEQAESHLADLLVQRFYLQWGVAAIEGLTIDGEGASVEQLIEKGPEPLCAEIVSSIRAQLELSEEERKNS